jgi:GMP synthase-like glutamine amidotransferase
MYKDDIFFQQCNKGYIYALKGNKIIIKKWHDVRGIRRTLKKGIDGIIISGSDYFVKESERSIIGENIISSNIPILAICYGFQYMVCRFGKKSYIKSNKCGYMKYTSNFCISNYAGQVAPFNIPKTKYFLYHTDYIIKVPKAFKVIKKIKNKIMIAYNSKKNILGVQFHPEKYKRASRMFFNLWINKCVNARK